MNELQEDYYYCRCLSAKDLDTFKKLSNECFTDLNYDDQQFNSMLEVNNYYTLGILNQNHDLIGYIATRLIHFHKQNDPIADEIIKAKFFGIESIDYLPSAYIALIATEKKYRRKGMATYLINEIEDYFKLSFNINNIYLHVQTNNLSALQLYSELGYEPLSENENYYKGTIRDGKIGSNNAYFCLKRFK